MFIFSTFEFYSYHYILVFCICTVTCVCDEPDVIWFSVHTYYQKLKISKKAPAKRTGFKRVGETPGEVDQLVSIMSAWFV